MVSRERAFSFLTLAAALCLVAACSRGADKVRPVARERSAAQPTPPAASPPDPTVAVQAEPRKSYEPLVKFDGGLSFDTEEIEEKDEKRKYEISFTYPRLRGASGPRVLSFNRAAAKLARKETNDFRSAYLGPPEQKRPRHWEDVFDTLSATHEEIYATDRVISIRFTVYSYGWGAAHSVQYFRVLNYDFKSGRQLRLQDLFRPGSKYLKPIAYFCTNTLREGDFFSQDRLSPKTKNYEDWNLTTEGLLISIPACEVAGCAAGAKEILIPYAALKDTLAPRGVAAAIAAEHADERNAGQQS